MQAISITTSSFVKFTGAAAISVSVNAVVMQRIWLTTDISGIGLLAAALAVNLLLVNYCVRVRQFAIAAGIVVGPVAVGAFVAWLISFLSGMATL